MTFLIANHDLKHLLVCCNGVQSPVYQQLQSPPGALQHEILKSYRYTSKVPVKVLGHLMMLCACLQEVEPTVTISTKAAFEALNSMFSGSLPHEQQAQREARDALHATGQLPPRPHRPRAKGLCTSQPPAQPETPVLSASFNQEADGPHADAHACSPAPFGIYEDTGLLTFSPRALGTNVNAAAPAGAAGLGSVVRDELAAGVEETGGLLVYEDTALLGGQAQQSAGFAGTASRDADETQGFVLYEDTALLQPPTSPAGDCTLDAQHRRMH